MSITILEPGRDPVDIVQNDPPTLAQLQAWVGGYIEIPGGTWSTGGGAMQLVVNEEGKLMGLPENLFATLVYDGLHVRAGRRPTDVLVGTVVVLTAPHLID